jgi:hypothetical protein
MKKGSEGGRKEAREKEKENHPTKRTCSEDHFSYFA